MVVDKFTNKNAFNNSNVRVAMKTQRVCLDSKGVKNTKAKIQRKHIDTT